MVVALAEAGPGSAPEHRPLLGWPASAGGQNEEFQGKIRNFGATPPCFSYLPPSRGKQAVTRFPTGGARVRVFALGSHVCHSPSLRPQFGGWGDSPGSRHPCPGVGAAAALPTLTHPPAASYRFPRRVHRLLFAQPQALGVALELFPLGRDPAQVSGCERRSIC